MGHHCPNDRFGEPALGSVKRMRGSVPQMIINQTNLLQLFQVQPQQAEVTFVI